MSRIHGFLRAVALLWILVAIGGVLASAPLAWRVLVELEAASPRQSLILAWVAVLVVLSLPAGIALAYAHLHTQQDRELKKWVPDDLARTC